MDATALGWDNRGGSRVGARHFVRHIRGTLVDFQLQRFVSAGEWLARREEMGQGSHASHGAPSGSDSAVNARREPNR